MNIRTVADGILGTHVTWDEFEGFASRCALIYCDWQGDDADELPKRVVLKMGSCLPLVALSQVLPAERNVFKDATPELWAMTEHGIKGMHNMECDTYDFLEQFGEGHAIPKRYYACAFNELNLVAGQICMEYVEHGRMFNFHECATEEQMKQIARALGRLQADSTKYEVHSESLKTKDVFGEFNRSTPKEQYYQLFTPIKVMDASLTEEVEKVEALLDVYYGATLPSTIHKQLGLAPVLVNGDMRTENVLVDEASGELRALIDWQCSHFGCGVEDLLHISFFAQSTDDRRATARGLLEEMYSAFIARLGDQPAPYSLEQLREVCDLLFPHCAIFFATGLGVLMPANMPRPGHEDASQQRKWEIVLDKASDV
ncbi:hypothetical protein PRIPAC_97109 [Pristionchus pacificus]|uniref:Phosphotransferase n=1 Tax=Pristionchus pacificus TaxID=54126 RepID=A0A2A6D351_PRIPA|nr:hypothetical protein PRIPAC_97109 [Pristionchus pacificus]|eukprot:PDM84766.1 phosphotransferase [Pristionchus pacificus]